MVAIVRLRRRHRRRLSLWIPLFLAWLLLAPVALVLLPFFFIACLVTWLNPFRALGVFGEILCSLKGTHIEVIEPENSILISIH